MHLGRGFKHHAYDFPFIKVIGRLLDVGHWPEPMCGSSWYDPKHLQRLLPIHSLD